MTVSEVPGDWTDQYAGSKLDLAAFHLSFSDEFDSMNVVPNRGTGTWYAPVHDPFGAAKFMSPVDVSNPFSVANGQLTISMKQVDGVWQSGTMQTVNSAGQGFSQQYGYFEMRAAFHGGQGAWPSFWLLPRDTTVPRPEIDVVEAYGGDPDGHHHTVHLSDLESHAWESDYTGLPGSMFDGGFHTYGAMITTDWITVFYDGEELSRFPMSDWFRTPLYMVVSLGMYSTAAPQASDMVLDYVRAYAAPPVMEQHLNGTDAADILTGGAFDDVLNGAGDADVMSGGLGNDTYYVDNASDIVVEAAGAGIDLIYSSVSRSLGGLQVERLTLAGPSDINATGNDLNNTLTGNDGGNRLAGLSGNDTLRGGAGADVLDGGAGADVMQGGAGDDRYYVDNGSDSLIEGAGEGTDRVYSSVAYSLPRDAENLTLTGAASVNGGGNGSANIVIGNSGNNTLSGYDGNDRLEGSGGDDRLSGHIGADILIGGPGADWMNGGTGDDRYYVDNALDTVVDEAGVDQIFSTVAYSLSDRLVENLTLTGSANSKGTGNFLDNVLVGNNGNNELFGSTGNDTLLGCGGDDVLIGGVGIDRLTGSGGSDAFVLNAALSADNRDSVTDFNPAADSFRFENAVMTALGAPGALRAEYFFAGAGAHDADDHIIYDRTTGSLFYDPDGNAAGAPTLLATLTNKPVLLLNDLVVV